MAKSLKTRIGELEGQAAVLAHQARESKTMTNADKMKASKAAVERRMQAQKLKEQLRNQSTDSNN
jgi:hypothetical protein